MIKKIILRAIFLSLYIEVSAQVKDEYVSANYLVLTI